MPEIAIAICLETNALMPCWQRREFHNGTLLDVAWLVCLEQKSLPA